MVEEVLDKGGEPLPVGDHFRPDQVFLDATAVTACGPTHPNEKPISKVRDLLDRTVWSERLARASEEVQSGRSAIDTPLGPPRIEPKKDVWVQGRGQRLPITTPERIAGPAREVDVLLRHRLLRQAHGFEGLLLG